MIPWEQLNEENARRRERGQQQVIDARAPMAKVQSGLQGGNPRMDALTWANTFKNSQTGRTTSPSAAQELRDRDLSNYSAGDNMKADRLLGVSAAAPAQPSILQSVLGDIHAGLNFSTNPLPTFAPLPQLGQAPSLTRLSEGAGNHAQQWTRAAQAPRRPYIGGASGDMTKEFVAGGKYSSYKAGSDPTLDKDRFSFASAFR